MKTSQIHIRVSPEQKAKLTLLAGSQSISEFMLTKSLNESLLPLPPGKVEFVPKQIPQKKIVEKSPEKPVLAKQTVLVRSFFKEPKK